MLRWPSNARSSPRRKLPWLTARVLPEEFRRQHCYLAGFIPGWMDWAVGVGWAQSPIGFKGQRIPYRFCSGVLPRACRCFYFGGFLFAIRVRFLIPKRVIFSQRVLRVFLGLLHIRPIRRGIISEPSGRRIKRVTETVTSGSDPILVS